MDRTEFDINVATLDGYLRGVAEFSGSIRDYIACAFVLDSEKYVDSVEMSLEEYFRPRVEIQLVCVSRLERGYRDIEQEIKPYLVRDGTRFSASEIDNLRSYLSFRVMDLIDLSLDRHEVVDVLKLVEGTAPLDTSSVFYCIRSKKGVLVLQFLDNIEFKKMATAGEIEFQ